MWEREGKRKRGRGEKKEKRNEGIKKGREKESEKDSMFLEIVKKFE